MLGGIAKIPILYRGTQVRKISELIYGDSVNVTD